MHGSVDVPVSYTHLDVYKRQDLSHLHDEVKQRFLKLDEEERRVRDTVAKMESGFVGRFAEFQHGR